MLASMRMSMCANLILCTVSCLAGPRVAWARQQTSQATSGDLRPSDAHSGSGFDQGSGTLVEPVDHAYGSRMPGAQRRLQQGDAEKAPTGMAAWNPRTHGYVAAISIGLLGPLAVVVSRNFREFRPFWIWVHSLLAVVALIGGVVGLIFGGKLPEDGLDESVYSAHKGIGGAAVALYGIQVLMASVRPNPSHKRRKLFNIAHHWTGRVGIALGIISVFIGLHLAEELNKFFWGYAIVLGVIILLWIVKEVLDLFAVLKSNRRGPGSHKMPGPVNGSFASVLLLHGRPAVGPEGSTHAKRGSTNDLMTRDEQIHHSGNLEMTNI